MSNSTGEDKGKLWKHIPPSEAKCLACGIQGKKPRGTQWGEVEAA
jgi:hypothetical protein